MEGVPRMPMLEIELKQNSFDYSALDWAGMPSEDVHEATQQQTVEGLKKHIKDEHGDDPEKYKEAIESFIELQSAAYKAVLSPDFEGCNTLKKYYGQLHYMQSRFPFSGDDSVKVTFAWQDAFTGILTVHESFTFEQTAILFNIGAVHSILGAMDNRTTEEGIRISCVHFQCAAGLFSYIADNFDTTLSADISQSILKLFTNLMLAQGQECLLEKSMQDNRKHSIVSKISKQVVEYYEQCLQSVANRENDLGSQACKLWKKLITLKITYYSAITKYYMGNNSQEHDKYGQAVALFGAAVGHLNEAAKHTKSLPKDIRPKVDEAIKFTSDVLNGKHSSAVKDNEFVYHDKIPEKSNLPEIKGASLVKALPFEPANPALTGPDIFAKLVPMEAHLAASSYSEEKAKLLRTVVATIDEKDEILKQYKQSIELDPSKLINLAESSKLDPSLVEKSASLSVDQSPIDNLDKAKDGLSDVYSELDSVLNDILTIVEDEETEDLKLKDKCGKDAFSSQEDIDGIKKELHVYKELYHKASQMKDDLHTACMIHIANMKLVAGGMDTLREELNLVNMADLLTEEEKNVVELVRKLCDKVVEMEEQRKDLLQQLRQQMETDDVTSTLVTKHGVDQADLFKEELKKHDSLIDTINMNLSAQDNILDAVTKANAKYTKIRKMAQAEKDRVDTKVNNLLQSCDSEDVIKKCAEGRKFFADILEKSQGLLERSTEFHDSNMSERKKIYKRWEEKEKAKRPPPRPSAPKPKLGPKKTTQSTTPTPRVPASMASTTGLLSPEILAKMMTEDGDDELLNDPEFLQFLQSQGDLHPVGLSPILPSSAPVQPGSLSTGMVRGNRLARPHTMPPPTSYQQMSRGQSEYPVGVPGHLAPPGSPALPSTGPSTPPSAQPGPFSSSGIPLQSVTPQVSSPVSNHPRNQQIQQNQLPSVQSATGTHVGPTDATLQNSIPQSYNPLPPDQDSRTVDTVGRPVSSLQDPRQVGAVSPAVSYQSQAPAGNPAYGQQYNSPPIVPQPQHMPQTPPVVSSPAPSFIPSRPHPGASPQITPQQMASNFSPSHSLTMPASYIPRDVPLPQAAAPMPQMTDSYHGVRPQIVHHNYYTGQTVPGQRQQQPVQVSQVAIVYSTPPPVQQSMSSTYTQPTSNDAPAPITQQAMPGQHLAVGYSQSVPAATFSASPQVHAGQISAQASSYQQTGPVSAGFQPAVSVPSSAYQMAPTQPSHNAIPQSFGAQAAFQHGYPNSVQQGHVPQQQYINNQSQLGLPAGMSSMGNRPYYTNTAQPQQGYMARPNVSMPQHSKPPTNPIVPPNHYSQQPPTPLHQANPNVQYAQQFQQAQGVNFQALNPAGAQVTPQLRHPITPMSYQDQPGYQQQQQPYVSAQMSQPQGWMLPEQRLIRPGGVQQSSGPMQHLQPGREINQQGHPQMNRPQQTNQGFTMGQAPGMGFMPGQAGQSTSQQFQQSLSQPVISQAQQPQQQIPFSSMPVVQSNQIAYQQPQRYVQQQTAPQTGAPIQPGQNTNAQGYPQQNIGARQQAPNPTTAPVQPTQIPDPNNLLPKIKPSQRQNIQGSGWQAVTPGHQASQPIGPQATQPDGNPGPQQNYIFKSHPHAGQYFATPSNENSPKHTVSQHSRQGSITSSASNQIRTSGPNFAEPMAVLTPTPVNPPAKPVPLPKQPSSDLAGLILTPTRTMSTSADELLSTNPDPGTIPAKDANQVVLVPTKIDEDSESMVVRPVEGLPYMDEADLMKFKGQVVDFRAKVHNLLTKPQTNDLCHLDREWKQLSETQEKYSRQLSTAVARCSSYKNRFQDIVPFDQSRVILREAKDDYINASVIDGVSPYCPRFIATQSPLPNTSSDFWLLVYEQQVTLIVMLVNSKDVPKKCPMYWPTDRSVPQQHGPVTVSFTTSKTHGDLYVERTFTVKHRNQSLAMSVTQLHYIAWPEHRLPSSASDLLTFIRVVQSYHSLQRNLQWPILVHCESGVGRTGVFCAFLAAINEINAGIGIIDVMDLITRMRKKRKYMVQEKAQLKFVYDVILYHAIDVLKQRRVVLEEEVKPASAPLQVHHPANPVQSSNGQFNIFSNQAALSSIQATVEKMTIKSACDKASEKGSEFHSPTISSKSCSDMPDLSAIASDTDHSIQSRPLTSEILIRPQFDQTTLPPANLGGISDLVHSTIPSPSPTSIGSAPDVGIPATNVGTKPDIVESCNNQVTNGHDGDDVTKNMSHNVEAAPASALIELLTPGSFTLDTTAEDSRKPRKVTKEDFFKPRPGFTSDKDPTDPFSGLDPLWGLKK